MSKNIRDPAELGRVERQAVHCGRGYFLETGCLTDTHSASGTEGIATNAVAYGVPLRSHSQPMQQEGGQQKALQGLKFLQSR